MKITTKNSVIVFTALFACAPVVLSVISCGNLDVVARDSERSFDNLLAALPPHKLDGIDGKGWALDAPDRAASFEILFEGKAPSDFSLALKIDAKPFLDAGWDTGKLNGWDFADGKLTYRLNFDKNTPSVSASPLEAYKHILKNYRSIVGYHAALDHYGINLGDGNLLEWAKDMSINDKDIVFVLNPEPFIAAGVDPSRIEGWSFAKVTVDDENGKPVQVDKILKPFDLNGNIK
ncbi:MAG: hypothetical protein LBG72_05635 [Spirochaetaceae bacterium]|jgi:hypothetical protein|nr:hypothetical protein [Spirochaetaceae bacterium]